MNIGLRIALLGLAILGAQPANAQDEDSIEPLPVYDVELIIFEYVNGVRGSREDWRYIDSGRERAQQEVAEQQAMNDQDFSALDLTDEPVKASDAELPEIAPVVLEFAPIGADDFRLKEQYLRLRGSSDYRPIVHTAWRQPVYPPAQETTLQLSSVAKQAPASLGGEVSLFVSRFLHLTLNLQLGADRAGTETLVYKLKEQRKMRSAELHFFDHPRFGALALISKAEPTDASSD